MTYRFADAALAEYIAAGQYYNRKVPGLGDAFVDEIEAGVRAILGNPRTWRIASSRTMFAAISSTGSHMASTIAANRTKAS
jgi:hypothetical protein